MITTFILQILYTFLTFMVGLIPTSFTIPQPWFDGLNLVWGYMNSFSFILPVGTLLTVLGLAIGFHLLIFFIRLVSWVLKKIPFIN